jgi:hypothetical protein
MLKVDIPPLGTGKIWIETAPKHQHRKVMTPDDGQEAGAGE